MTPFEAEVNAYSSALEGEFFERDYSQEILGYNEGVRTEVIDSALNELLVFADPVEVASPDELRAENIGQIATIETAPKITEETIKTEMASQAVRQKPRELTVENARAATLAAYDEPSAVASFDVNNDQFAIAG